jgi:dihydroorotate dehydrogenase
MSLGLYALARPALFALEAERAHELTLRLLASHPGLGGLFGLGLRHDPVRLMGLEFRNRVGLAAGLDKNGECVEAFDAMGFGFIEVGTVTPRPQAGNPRPRMFRLPRQQALINRLGFNNHGVDALVARVKRARRQSVLGVNIGKNADTPLEKADEDYLICLRKVYPVADYVVVNVSSPNTVGLRMLQEDARFAALVASLDGERRALGDRYGKRVPLLVKIAPDLAEDDLLSLARTAVEGGIDGLIATNTTIGRPGLESVPLAAEKGGLSGAPLRPLADQVLARLRREVGPDYPLVGVGGILDGAQARAKRECGADLVQIYTGLIYRGPGLVRDCIAALRDIPSRGLPANSGVQ